MQDDFTSPERILRFDLAIQRNHLIVFSTSLAAALIGYAIGGYQMKVGLVITLWFAACAVSLLLASFYRRGVSRDVLNVVWIVTDVCIVSIGIAISGGLKSPGYLWYPTIAAAAAFVVGKRGAFITLGGSMLAYLVVLGAMGQIHPVDAPFTDAVTRSLFLAGATYFSIAGIANLQEKRLRIRTLEIGAQRQIAELRRLTHELSLASERIQEADRLKSRFLANMSHELRTPMNSIIGFSQVLMERLDGKIERKHHGFLRHINSSGEHLLNIINGVLDLSKVESGRMEIYPEFFLPAPIIESVCGEARAFASERRIVTSVPSGLPRIETDVVKFRQILLNLLSNAVKFSPDGSEITITAGLQRGDPDKLTVSVRDEGIGIAPADQEVIFEEFRQIDMAPRQDRGGTGLGLAIVRKLVELQHGRVTVTSEAGKGSTFSFSLPVRTRAIDELEAVPVSSDGSLKVLVVEDDATAWTTIAETLHSAGYVPVRARFAEEALRLARESTPAAITLDLVLPGVDGWELLRRLKSDETTCDIPVVIISRVDQRDLAVAMGAQDYFVKPVDTERLVRRLTRITGKKRPRLLVIDDDHAVHALLVEKLLECEVEGALDGESGIAAAQAATYDAIILDLVMPGMSGFEVADSLKEDVRTAQIPILLLTAKELTDEDRTQLSDRITALVHKGRNAHEQLLQELRRLGTTASRA